MNNKALKILVALTLALGALTVFGQTTPAPTITINGTTVPVILGTPITINGQTLLVTTNSAGQYIVSTSGPAGTNSMTVPSNATDLGNFILNAVENNNPANIGYYSTNGEWDVRLGAVYSQNSGQAAALLEVERYGLISPNIGVGLGVLEGNQSGQNGTAAAYALLDYRHPIGDVSFNGGLFAGYDNYTKHAMGGPKVGIEYRQSPHLGEFAGVGYTFEGLGSKNSGLTFNAGLEYAF